MDFNLESFIAEYVLFSYRIISKSLKDCQASIIMAEVPFKKPETQPDTKKNRNGLSIIAWHICDVHISSSMIL
jgi:hypothetical protein